MSENKVILDIDRTKYQTSVSPSGKKSLNNGDPIAILLAGLNLEEVQAIADKVYPDNDFRTKYEKRNNGMQRMIIGNRLRGFVAKRNKENAAEEAKAKAEDRAPKLKLEGLEGLTKAAGPVRKSADRRISDADKAKTVALKAKADAAAAKKKAA